MIETVNLPLILMAALLASTSPRPATLAIAGASMTSGRRAGFALASSVTTGSFLWSVSAAFGLGAVMLAHGWLFEIIRYVGAAYLGWLALKSARSAWLGKRLRTPEIQVASVKRAYARGLAIHLTNPKAILFFGAVYSIGVPPRHPGQQPYHRHCRRHPAKHDRFSLLRHDIFQHPVDCHLRPDETRL